MVPEVLSSAPASDPQVVRHRYRLRFAKTGDLRLVSHHDLMHVLERLMRRAEIPFAVTQGFHPQPKMTFALSLALGVAGLHEVLELELTQPLDPQDLLARLRTHAPAGLLFLSIAPPPGRASARVRRAFYRLGLPEVNADLDERLRRFLGESEHWIVRTRPNPRRLNIRPYVAELTIGNGSWPETTNHESGTHPLSPASGLWPKATSHEPKAFLQMILWITPTGAARPEEIVNALGLAPLLEEGAILERTHLELLDEVAEHERFVPDLSAATEAATEPRNDASPSGEPRPRSNAPTSLVSNPLSFDS